VVRLGGEVVCAWLCSADTLVREALFERVGVLVSSRSPAITIAGKIRKLQSKYRQTMDWQALALTLRLAALVSAALVCLGLPIAYWITYSPWRWKFLVEAVVALPLVLPPTVLGFYLLIALGPRSPLGRWWQVLTGHTLAFTFEGLLLGSILYSLPFAVQPFAASFAAVDPRLLAASATLGASRWRTFFRVILPLSGVGVLTGVVLSFAHTLGEFGVVLMVGGNIPGVTRTVSIDIFDKVQAVDYEAANQTALVLLVVSFLALSLVYAMNRYAMSRGALFFGLNHIGARKIDTNKIGTSNENGGAPRA